MAMERRYFAFGLGFPVAVALCFIAIAVLMYRQEPEQLYALPYPVFIGVVALLIIVPAGVCGAFAGMQLSQRWLRRVLMAAAVGLGLFAAALGLAVLVGYRDAPRIAGQGSAGSTMSGHGIDLMALAIGSGAALALAVVMFFVFQPLPQWGAKDDQALAAAMAEAAGAPRIRVVLTVRASNIVLLVMAALLPGGLLLLLSPWLSLAWMLLCLLLVMQLVAVLRIQGAEVSMPRLSLWIVGIIPVVNFPVAHISQAEATRFELWSCGGPGLRRRADGWQFLITGGHAVVVHTREGATVTLGVPSAQKAAELAEQLNRRVG